MTDWQHFVWLGKIALGASVLTWPVPLVLFAVALVIQARARTLWVAGRLRLWTIVVPAASPPVMLSAGVLWACQNCSPSRDQGGRFDSASAFVTLLLLAQLAWVAWVVFRSPGRQGTTALVQCVLFWCSLSAAFVAGMSISGDWL